MNSFWHALTRKKRNDTEEVSKLNRVLNLFDLTALGVGSTLGLGVYVLAGSVAYEQAGPAVTISFLIAAIASAFAGLCYAEFAARVPKAGSAYVYSYVSVGEFVAFTIGWNLILEYVIGTSSVARGLSGYIDALIDDKMGQFWEDLFPMNVSFLAKYPDFFAFGVILLLAAILSLGVRESSLLNNVFTAVNLVTVAIVLVAGGIKANPSNWAIAKEDIPTDDPKIRGGEGGFMPFGIAGIMAGAAKCFYGFVGFDCVATTGEEAINPKRNIPLAIITSLIIIFLAYFGISTVLTMMWPYYDQDPTAPFPYVFEKLDMITIKWIVSIGAIFALTTSLLGAMFPLPRVLYAMGKDGVIFKFFASVHPRTQTPLLATLTSGLLAAIMALAFNLQQLIDMMSIGTLMAYTIVAICVLVLHYNCPDEIESPQSPSITTIIRQLTNFKFTKVPNKLSSGITKIGICTFALLAMGISGILKFNLSAVTIALIAIVAAALILNVLIIYRQPRDRSVDLTFEVPLVPVLPCLSILINLYLMFQLDGNTWIRFLVWLVIGYIIYFTYGIRMSEEGKKSRQDLEFTKPPLEQSKIESNSDQYRTSYN